VTAKLAQGALYAPKTLCAISRAPIYGALRQFLAHLYRTAAVPPPPLTLTAAAAAGSDDNSGERRRSSAASTSTLPSPLWQLSVSVRMFVSCLPMPLAGGRAFHVHLPGGGGAAAPLYYSSNSSSSSSLTIKTRRSISSSTTSTSGTADSPGSDAPQGETGGCGGPESSGLVLSAPPSAWLPLMDIDYTAPFRCLSVANVAAVFGLVLQEAKLVFLSTRLALLTQVSDEQARCCCSVFYAVLLLCCVCAPTVCGSSVLLMLGSIATMFCV
jgi:DENN (AEX-3) domain